jgi:hypothetical protein
MNSALTWARLSYRQQRWELILVAVGVMGVAAGMLWFASTLDAIRAGSPECLEGAGIGSGLAFPDETGPPAECQTLLNEFYATQSIATNLMNVAWAAPFGLGVILGAPIVAREIDGGTAQLAWSLSRSRVSWLLRRIAFVALVALTMLAVLAVTSELLATAINQRDLDEDFAFFGQRGLPLVARGAGAIMIGTLVGALIGRVLPAVLASVLVIGLVFVGLSIAHDRWNEGEARMQRFWDDAGKPVPFDSGALDVDYGLQTPDGAFLSYGEAYERGLPIENFQDEQGRVYASAADLQAGKVFGHDVRLSIPGDRYPELVVRDSIVAVFVGVVALGATAAVVQRRRPR